MKINTKIIPETKQFELHSIKCSEDENAVKVVREIFGRKATVEHLLVFITVVDFAEKKVTEMDKVLQSEEVEMQINQFIEEYSEVVKSQNLLHMTDEKMKKFIKEAFILGTRKYFRLLKWALEINKEYPEAILE